MSKQNIEMYLYMTRAFNKRTFVPEWAPQLWNTRLTENSSFVYVKQVTVTVDVPETFDPRPAQIKALEAEKAKAGREFAETVSRINKELSKLQAIEHKGE